MKIRTNKIMDSYLAQLGFDFLKKDISLPKKLEEIVSRPFLTDNGITTLKAPQSKKGNPHFKTNFEKSVYEYDEHFHPDMFASKKKGEIEYLLLALECAKRLYKRLKKLPGKKQFRILVSFSETLKKGRNIESSGSSTVRFFQVRPRCNKLYVTNLDEYETEAVLELET